MRRVKTRKIVLDCLGENSFTMRLSTRCILWCLFSVALGKGLDEKQMKSPNIIFILVDDLGWNDVGFHGMKDIPTPNIDALAAESIVLNNYYVEPLCTPSRSALLTGLYPIRTGTQHFVIKSSEGRGLPLQFQTLPQKLNKLNYMSKIVGKWHLGFHKSSYTPLARGFFSHYGFWTGAMDFFAHETSTQLLGNDSQNFPYFNSQQPIILNGKSMRDNLIPVNHRQGEYLTHILSQEAQHVIRSHNQSRPLFLYLAHHAPHRGNNMVPVRGPPGTDSNFAYIENETRRNFAGVLKALDDSVGDIIEALKATGMLKNSLIVLSSDNGAEIHTQFPSGGSNYPLRGQKFTSWEGGVRSIGMVWSPRFEKPRVSNQLFHIVDWMPTLYRAAGGNPKDLGFIDGIDMWQALMKDSSSPRKEVLISLDPVWRMAAIRSGKYKLLYGKVPMANVDGWYDVVKGNDSVISLVEESKTSKALTSLRRELGTSGEDVTNNRRLFPLEVNCHTSYSETKPCSLEHGPCLFDVEDDPCELNNLAVLEPQIVEQMIDRLKYYKSMAVEPSNVPNDYLANPDFYDGFWSSWLDVKDTYGSVTAYSFVQHT